MIWLVAIVFNLPLLLTIYYNKQSDFCMQYWPQQWMVKVNTIVWFLVTGVIPIVLMTVLYLRVVNALWFQNEDRSDNVRQVSIVSTELFLSFDSYDTKRLLHKNTDSSEHGFEIVAGFPHYSRAPGGQETLSPPNFATALNNHVSYTG